MIQGKKIESLPELITINISDEQRERAETWFAWKTPLKNSIREGEGDIIGALGEIVVYDHFGKRVKCRSDEIGKKERYHYDLIIDDNKVDVKTKSTTVPPLSHYFCTVWGQNPYQRCDYYFFARVTDDLSIAYLIGYLRKIDFFNKEICKFYLRGQIDPTSTTNPPWRFRDYCYNVEARNVKPFITKKKI